VSRSDHAGATVPTEEYRFNLDAYGFETKPEAPHRISGELSRDANGQHLLEIETSDDEVWRVELAITGSGRLEARVVYRDGALVAAEGDAEIESVDQLPEWVQFVVDQVAREVST
jgi:hypothetical protein